MKAKKTLIALFGAFTLMLVPTTLSAQESDKPLTERLKDRVVIEKEERTSEIESRLIEIKNMDMYSDNDEGGEEEHEEMEDEQEEEN